MKTLSIGYTSGTFTDAFNKNYPLKNIFVSDIKNLSGGDGEASAFGKTGIVDISVPNDISKEVSFLIEVTYEIEDKDTGSVPVVGHGSFVAQIKNNNIRITKGNPNLDINVIVIH